MNPFAVLTVFRERSLAKRIGLTPNPWSFFSPEEELRKKIFFPGSFSRGKNSEFFPRGRGHLSAGDEETLHSVSGFRSYGRRVRVEKPAGDGCPLTRGIPASRHLPIAACGPGARTPGVRARARVRQLPLISLRACRESGVRACFPADFQCHRAGAVCLCAHGDAALSDAKNLKRHHVVSSEP